MQAIQRVNTYSAASRTITLDDGAAVLCTDDYATTITVTVPTNATLALPIGYQTNIAAINTGKVTISPAGGVTVISDGSLLSIKSKTAGTLYKIGTNTWLLWGTLVA